MLLLKFRFRFVSFLVFALTALLTSTGLTAATTISLGSKVTLSVTVQGTAPFSYQWYKDGAAISGAKGSAYTVFSMQPINAGVYHAVVANSAGSTAAEKVTLLTLSTIVFTTQPASTSAVVGGSATFSAAASGLPSPTYQWRKNGVNISGATGSSYTVSKVSVGDAGAYTVVASNLLGSATSDAATLTVNTSAPTGKVGADFSGDGRSDILWQNILTGQHVIWLMNGTTNTGSVTLSTETPDWVIVGLGDFNGDGRPDILWQNSLNGRYGLWLMNGTTMSTWVDLGTVPAPWRIEGVGDFNGDGQADIIWRNTSTNEYMIRLMKGTTSGASYSLGIVDREWHVASTADFDGDGKTDILWESNTQSGFGLWLMNGPSFSRWINLGVLPADWSIGGTGDFNGDGRPDILWQNTKTGERKVRLMNGTTLIGVVPLDSAPPEWSMAN